MRIRHLLILLTLLALGACTHGARPTSGEAPRDAAAELRVRLVSGVWPPFTDVDDRASVAVSLVHEALLRAGVAVTSDILATADLVEAVRSGAFDGSEAFWRTPEREQFLLYSRPYLQNRLVLLGRRGADVSATTLSMLPGKRVGVVKGYAYGPAVDEASDVVLVAGASDAENLRALLSGALDYVLVDELLVYHLAVQHPEKSAELLVAGKHPLVERQLHFVLRRDVPHAGEIMARFDAELDQLVADGTYNEILGVDWLLADVDGDATAELVGRGDHVGTAPPSAAYPLVQRGAPAAPRIFVHGSYYERWDDVPREYKEPSDDGLGFEPGVGVVLYEW